MAKDDDERGRRGRDDKLGDDKDDQESEEQKNDNRPRILRLPLNLSPSKSPQRIILRTNKSNGPSPGSPSRGVKSPLRVKGVHTISAKASFSPLRPRLADFSRPASPCATRRRAATVSKSSGGGTLESYMRLFDVPTLSSELGCLNTSQQTASQFGQATTKWPKFPAATGARISPAAIKRFSEPEGNERLRVVPSRNAVPKQAPSPLRMARSPKAAHYRGEAAPSSAFADKLREVASSQRLRVVSGNIQRPSQAEVQRARLSPPLPQNLRYSINELLRLRSSAIEEPVLLNKPLTETDASTAQWVSKQSDSSTYTSREVSGEHPHFNHTRAPRQNYHFTRGRLHRGDFVQDSFKSVRFDPAVVAWSPAYANHNPVNAFQNNCQRNTNAPYNRRFDSRSGDSETSIIHTPPNQQGSFQQIHHQRPTINGMAVHQILPQGVPKMAHPHSIVSGSFDTSKLRSIAGSLDGIDGNSKARRIETSAEGISPCSKLKSKIWDFKKSIAEFKTAHPELIRSNPKLLDDILEALKGTGSDDEQEIKLAAAKEHQKAGELSTAEMSTRSVNLKTASFIPQAPKPDLSTQPGPKGSPIKKLNPNAPEFRNTGVEVPRVQEKVNEFQHQSAQLPFGRVVQHLHVDRAQGLPLEQDVNPSKPTEGVHESSTALWQRVQHSFAQPSIANTVERGGVRAYEQANWFNGLIPLLPVPPQYPFVPLDTPFGPMAICALPTNDGLMNAVCPPIGLPGCGLPLPPYQVPFNQGDQISRHLSEGSNVSTFNSLKRHTTTIVTGQGIPSTVNVDEDGPGRFAKGLDTGWRERVLEEFKTRYPLTGDVPLEKSSKQEQTEIEDSNNTKLSPSHAKDPAKDTCRARVASMPDPELALQEEFREKDFLQAKSKSVQLSELNGVCSNESGTGLPVVSTIPDEIQSVETLTVEVPVVKPLQPGNAKPAQSLNLNGKNPPNKFFKPGHYRKNMSSIPQRRSIHPAEFHRKKAATEIQQKLEILILHQKEKKALAHLTRFDKGGPSSRK